jgi:hypothetical protein
MCLADAAAAFFLSASDKFDVADGFKLKEQSNKTRILATPFDTVKSKLKEKG